MVVKASIFETRGGALLAEVDPVDISWSENANQAETIDSTFDLRSLVDGARDWRNLATPWKHSLAIDVDGRVLGGPIMPHDFDGGTGKLKFTARGLRTAFARRSVLPLAVMDNPSMLLPNGDPDPSLDSNWSGFDLGTIAKKIGQQACAWPGWTDIPILWPADRAGNRERNYAALDKKNVDAAWSDLSNVQNGPDIRLRLEHDGPDRFRWVFESGTEEQPRLQGLEAFEWEAGQESGLSVKANPSRMGSLSWSQGGRSEDTALVRMMFDPFLVDAGLPLLELDSDASANTVEAATLDAWNVETLRTARKPWEFWSFDVRTDRSPYPYEYAPGALVNVIVTEDAPVPGGYIPPGTYTRRIAGLSGGLGDTITITCGEVYDE